MAKVYDNPYEVPSVYANVVELLSARDKSNSANSVHLDIGCGFGPIAEPIRDQLKLKYIGFDAAEDGLESLASRGFESHKVDLNDIKACEKVIRKAVGSRLISSITIIDTLEHLVNDDEVLQMLHKLAVPGNSCLVISVPNITHKDIAIKALVGRWDITESGILDHTHTRAFNETALHNLASRTGWVQVGDRDWRLEHSDQFFPSDVAALDVATPVGSMLRQLVQSTNRNALVSQFVRVYQPANPQDVSFPSRKDLTYAYDIALVVDYRGLGDNLIAGLNETLLSQTNQSFQLVAIASEEAQALSSSLKSAFGMRLLLKESSANTAQCLLEVLPYLQSRHVACCGSSLLRNASWLESLAATSAVNSNSVLKLTAQLDNEIKTPFRLIDRDIISAQYQFALPVSALRHFDFGMASIIGDGIATVIADAINICGVVSVGLGDLTALSARELADEQFGRDFHHILGAMNRRPQLVQAGDAVKIQLLEDQLQTRSRMPAWIPAQISKLLANNGLPSVEGQFSSTKPFLTVVTRTMGTRNTTLRETIMSLAAQTCTDIFLIVVLHNATPQANAEVRKLLDDMPSGFRDQLMLLECNRPGRSSPLNDALTHVVTPYVSVLDDDDFVFPHWVETFRSLANDHPGKMLRARCVRQDFEMDDESRKVPRAASWFKTDWPANYNAVEHLHANYTPFMSVALPTEAFSQMGIRWDEALSTTEDWHLMTRLAMLCGVAASPEVTCVYRWWLKSESSAFLHAPSEWEDNRQRIIDMFNNDFVILPPGSARAISDLIEARSELHRLLGLSNRRLLAERIWSFDRTRPNTFLGKVVKILKRIG